MWQPLNRPAQDPRKNVLPLVAVLVALMIAFVIIQRITLPPGSANTLDYKAFYQKLEANQIQTFDAVGLHATGTLTTGQSYQTDLPNRDAAFANEVVRHVKGSVKFESAQNVSLLSNVVAIVPFLVLACVLFMILRAAQRQQPPR